MTPLSFTEFRSCFPLLARQAYLNNCSQGVLADDVRLAFTGFLDSWDEHGSPWEHWVEQVEVLRAVFAGSIGADADEVAIMPSASIGLNAIASALSFHRRRDVVLGDFEFPTAAHVWLAQQPRGARLKWARSSGHTLAVDAYARLVDEDTLIVPATHVCFRNGFRMDVAGLAALCHDRGALFLVDDFQRTGTGPIDVHALNVDFMVTGALKYLLGPSGIAFLYVRRALIAHLQPTVTGWFGRVNPFAFNIETLDWAATAARFEAGTPPVPNAYATLAALRLLARLEPSAVERRIAGLVERFASGALAAGYRMLTPEDPARRGPLVVLHSTDAPALVERMKQRHVITSARGNGLRVSFHAYNNEDDVDAALAALAAHEALVVRA
jgi:selenocysteine lyase/cysteine desulfurase